MRAQALRSPLYNIMASLPAELQAQLWQGSQAPKRYFYQRPEDNGTFILPLKQSFIKDARLMPGTRCMLALLAGWAGQGRALELTKGTIAKHIGRCTRQVFRYIQDAAREGYLRYSYTKNRMGMITGLRVWLSFDLLRAEQRKSGKNQANQAVTHPSHINKNHIYIDKRDPILDEKLEQLRLLIE